MSQLIKKASKAFLITCQPGDQILFSMTHNGEPHQGTVEKIENRNITINTEAGPITLPSAWLKITTLS